MRKYTEETPLPILKEFCLQQDIAYKYLLQLCASDADLDRARERLLCKKEVQLEKALMNGTNNTAFIFQLKQLGWKDNPEPLVVNTIHNETISREEKLNKLSSEKLEELESIYEELEKDS